MTAYSSSNPYRASFRFVFTSFVLAFVFDLMPWSAEYFFWLPEASLLILSYWVLHRPESVGSGTAFCLGLLIDIALLSPLGQHALSYAIIAFLLARQQRQILLYHYGLQAIILASLFLLHSGIMSVARLFYDQVFYGWAYFTPALTVLVVWPILNTVMVNIMHWRQNKR